MYKNIDIIFVYFLHVRYVYRNYRRPFFSGKPFGGSVDVGQC